MFKISTRESLVLALLIGSALAFGCGSGTATSDNAAEPAAPVEAAEPAAPVDFDAILALADKADGTTDQVVQKCAGCALMMDGSDEHALAVRDHEFHFCSGHCKDTFAEDADRALVAMADTVATTP